mmetsp:Transcript_11250/g.38348  ORF Transcript_11250/g.38348 Transcript_11250/m.38348 type:complete len:299 (+) Transcript_11250:130-1026(+)
MPRSSSRFLRPNASSSAGRLRHIQPMAQWRGVTAISAEGLMGTIQPSWSCSLRYATRSAMVVNTRLCSLANSRSSGMRAIVRPSADTTSQRAPQGSSPASLSRSTVASVWPWRSTTPPGRARRGKMWPGRLKASPFVVGSASCRSVSARSPADIPVVVPTLASTDTVKAVPFGSWLLTTMGGSSSSSILSPGMLTQMSPEVKRTMNAIVSGVANCDAMIRSPSFSRSSSSLTRIRSPRRRASAAAMTESCPKPLCVPPFSVAPWPFWATFPAPSDFNSVPSSRYLLMRSLPAVFTSAC